ncbi:unnamed protein product [Bursaphelenchus xylophilus]|uniref:(pine wood nematode) hypothetical protein n=1 Tax=Bursaphelenchus xylophilus TaxID=6326 RepID=A0A1I7S4K3_BURXY|nr:unnamed protein product [Bursaphelenchus xylophilus]CAG9117195.1 unnamed protein product [Bursaphelenchus xylophilus]
MLRSTALAVFVLGCFCLSNAITQESLEDEDSQQTRRGYKFHNPVPATPHSPWLSGPNEKKYSFHIGQQSWVAAREICLTNNADLATISSEEELEWILSHYKPQLRHSKDRQIQVGLYAEIEEDEPMREWKWVTGEAVNSSILSWASGEPFDHANGKERCGLLNINSKTLDDVDCELGGSPLRFYRFICERTFNQHLKHEELNNPMWKKLEDILVFFGISDRTKAKNSNSTDSNESLKATPLEDEDYDEKKDLKKVNATEIKKESKVERAPVKPDEKPLKDDKIVEDKDKKLQTHSQAFAAKTIETAPTRDDSDLLVITNLEPLRDAGKFDGVTESSIRTTRPDPLAHLADTLEQAVESDAPGDDDAKMKNLERIINAVQKMVGDDDKDKVGWETVRARIHSEKRPKFGPTIESENENSNSERSNSNSERSDDPTYKSDNGNSKSENPNSKTENSHFPSENRNSKSVDPSDSSEVHHISHHDSHRHPHFSFPDIFDEILGPMLPRPFRPRPFDRPEHRDTRKWQHPDKSHLQNREMSEINRQYGQKTVESTTLIPKTGEIEGSGQDIEIPIEVFTKAKAEVSTTRPNLSNIEPHWVVRKTFYAQPHQKRKIKVTEPHRNPDRETLPESFEFDRDEPEPQEQTTKTPAEKIQFVESKQKTEIEQNAVEATEPVNPTEQFQIALSLDEDFKQAQKEQQAHPGVNSGDLLIIPKSSEEIVGCGAKNLKKESTVSTTPSPAQIEERNLHINAFLNNLRDLLNRSDSTVLSNLFEANYTDSAENLADKLERASQLARTTQSVPPSPEELERLRKNIENDVLKSIEELGETEDREFKSMEVAEKDLEAIGSGLEPPAEKLISLTPVALTAHQQIIVEKKTESPEEANVSGYTPKTTVELAKEKKTKKFFVLSSAEAAENAAETEGFLAKNEEEKPVEIEASTKQTATSIIPESEEDSAEAIEGSGQAPVGTRRTEVKEQGKQHKKPRQSLFPDLDFSLLNNKKLAEEAAESSKKQKAQADEAYKALAKLDQNSLAARIAASEAQRKKAEQKTDEIKDPIQVKKIQVQPALMKNKKPEDVAKQLEKMFFDWSNGAFGVLNG